jgi:hypothetical protein
MSELKLKNVWTTALNLTNRSINLVDKSTALLENEIIELERSQSVRHTSNRYERKAEAQATASSLGMSEDETKEFLALL